MLPDKRPIEPDETALLFAPHIRGRADGPVALAVSGGSDSTALMVLFADWLRLGQIATGDCTVLTVDHGLRPESAAEARQVCQQAKMLGFRHATLVWEGTKPRTGLQAAARRARYALMVDYLVAHGIGTLLTAHTRDDQAETLLMRLARGSGLDGLAGIAPSSEMLHGPPRAPLRVVRPLLDVPKSRLEATLVHRGVAWSEDPTNLSPAYERSRLRRARASLEAVGLSSEMVATSARRLQRVRAAVDAATDALCAPAGGVVGTERCGSFRIDRRRLEHTPEEVFLRLMGRCIAAAGGFDAPVPLAKLELVCAELQDTASAERRAWTLARARILADRDTIQIEREPGRVPLPTAILAGGEALLWDGRFSVAATDEFEGKAELRAVGGPGLGELRRLGMATATSRALRLAPAFWRGSHLLAVPCVDFWATPALKRALSAAFIGLRYNSAPACDNRGDVSGTP